MSDHPDIYCPDHPDAEMVVAIAVRPDELPPGRYRGELVRLVPARDIPNTYLVRHSGECGQCGRAAVQGAVCNHKINARTRVCDGCGATEQQLAMAPRPRSRTAVCTDARCVCEGTTLRCTRSDMLDGRYVFKGYA